jgi:hypothetical protein
MILPTGLKKQKCFYNKTSRVDRTVFLGENDTTIRDISSQKIESCAVMLKQVKLSLKREPYESHTFVRMRDTHTHTHTHIYL